MSLIVVHLRWDEVGPEQYDHLCRTLPDGPQRPTGCLVRRRQRRGRAVVASEVWIDEQHAGEFLTGLPELLGPAGLGDPQRAVFAVPECFAAGYGVAPARTRGTTSAAPVAPTPRVPGDAPLPTAPADRARMTPSV